jgi:hypothetical protein
VPLPLSNLEAMGQGLVGLLEMWKETALQQSFRDTTTVLGGAKSGTRHAGVLLKELRLGIRAI